MYAGVIRDDDVSVAMASCGFAVYICMGCGAEGGAHECIIWPGLSEWVTEEDEVHRSLEKRITEDTESR